MTSGVVGAPETPAP